MEFNIIEGSQPRYIEEFDKFIELYTNPNIPKMKIPEKLGWSIRQYTKARKKAIKDGLIPDNTNPKNYHYSTPKKKWIVRKITKNINIYTTCNNEKQAKKLVKYLNENGWTRENITVFKDKWKKWDSKSK